MVVGKQNKKLSVYYDGKCRVCSAEISHYMKKDKKKNICFVDITGSLHTFPKTKVSD